MPKDGLTDAVRELGPPQEQFGPSRWNLATGILIGILVAIPGLGILALGLFSAGATALIDIGMYALVYLAIGCAFFIYVRRLASQRVLLCPGGLIYSSGWRALAFPWDKIESVTVQTFPLGDVEERVQLSESDIDMHQASCFVWIVRRIDGVEIRLTKNKVKNLLRLIRIIRDHTQNLPVAWWRWS